MNFVNFPIFSTQYQYLTPIFMIDKSIYFILDFFIIFLFFLAIFEYHYLYKELTVIIVINFVLELLYNIFMFFLPSPFFMFATKLFQFVFSIHLNSHIYSNKKSANLIIPYILWNFILTLLSIIILFLNV